MATVFFPQLGMLDLCKQDWPETVAPRFKESRGYMNRAYYVTRDRQVSQWGRCGLIRYCEPWKDPLSRATHPFEGAGIAISVLPSTFVHEA